MCTMIMNWMSVKEGKEEVKSGGKMITVIPLLKEIIGL